MNLVKLIEDDLMPRLDKEAARLTEFDNWARMVNPLPSAPRLASDEIRNLVKLSRTPMLRLIVDTMVQAMYVDGYRSTDSTEESALWRYWTANSMDSRQVPLHRAAITFGYSFITVTPGTSPVDGSPMPVMRGVSPRRMWASWEDPAADEFPVHALRDMGNDRFRFYDAERIVDLGRVKKEKDTGYDWTILGQTEHTAGVCPVVRYENDLDLEGRCTGEIEPYISLAERINKTAYDRLMVQHFNSWKVWTATGMESPGGMTNDEKNRAKMRIRQDDILIGGDGAKFDTLEETSIDPFLGAITLDIETLAAASQTPSNNLTGKMTNLSAEALAAARAPLTQKIAERQHRFGEAHAKSLRLCAAVDGDMDAAQDFTSRITWEDMEIRSLAQAVDALGKAAQMLGVPPQVLWGRIPGVTNADVEDWKRVAAEGDPLSDFVNDVFGGNDYGEAPAHTEESRHGDYDAR